MPKSTERRIITGMDEPVSRVMKRLNRHLRIRQRVYHG